MAELCVPTRPTDINMVLTFMHQQNGTLAKLSDVRHVSVLDRDKVHLALAEVADEYFGDEWSLLNHASGLFGYAAFRDETDECIYAETGPGD